MKRTGGITRRSFLRKGLLVGASTMAPAWSSASLAGVGEDLLQIKKELEDRVAATKEGYLDKLLGYDKPYSMLFGFVALDCPHCKDWLDSREASLARLAEKGRFYLKPLSPFYPKDGRSYPAPAVDVCYAMMRAASPYLTSKDVISAARILAHAIQDDKAKLYTYDQVASVLKKGGVQLNDEVKKYFSSDVVVADYWMAVDVFKGMKLDRVPVVVTDKPERVVSFDGDLGAFMSESDKLLHKAFEAL